MRSAQRTRSLRTVHREPRTANRLPQPNELNEPHEPNEPNE